MNESLKRLIAVQEIDTALDALREESEKLQEGLRMIRQEMEEARGAFEALKKEGILFQTEKKSQEMDLETQEEAFKKHQRELNTVKSNDAYTALLKQIETVKSEKGVLEDTLLTLLQKIEDHGKALTAKDRELKEREKKAGEEMLAIETQIKANESQRESQEKIRRERLEQIPAGAMTRYEAIRHIKQGMAVVPIAGEICGGCHRRLPAFVIDAVRKDQALIACESCSRILYTPSPQKDSVSLM